MRISRVKIENYRNIKHIDVLLEKICVVIGENNGGKSNFLKALTLPLSNDEIGSYSKRLGWTDINDSAKDIYYNFIRDNFEEIKNGSVDFEEFEGVIPRVSIDVFFTPSENDSTEKYYLKNLITHLDGTNGNHEYGIRYEYYVKNTKELFGKVIETLNIVTDISDVRMNLLPIEFFTYSLCVPITGIEVSYNDITNFKYNSIAAERDEFSNRGTQIGSKALVDLLNSKLEGEQKVNIEKAYFEFFNHLSKIKEIEKVFDWDENTVVKNAKDFFEEITLLPNMPPMTSLLKNIRLGYQDAFLDTQGLGYRNLIFLLVMTNSLKTGSGEALNVLTIEEPEAHLCISNEMLFSSFVSSIVQDSSASQIFTSTHSTAILDKLDLSNVIVMNNGEAFALKNELSEKQLKYLAKKPNLDFLKFLFSRNTILVEGPSEEMLIRSYISLQKEELSDIVVVSLHKGFTEMIKIWLKVNKNTPHKLGVIRDFDNQPTAKRNHEKYNELSNILVTTTVNYTLEDDFVTGTNYKYLKKYFETEHGWTKIDTPERLSEKWKSAKTKTMLEFCNDFGTGDLENVFLPKHIQEVLDFLK